MRRGLPTAPILTTRGRLRFRENDQPFAIVRSHLGDDIVGRTGLLHDDDAIADELIRTSRSDFPGV